MPDFYSSSFGASSSNWGTESRAFRANEHHYGPRYAVLDRHQAYFKATQHDWKRFDFDGRIISSGIAGMTQPLISAERAPFYVPLRERRPSATDRVGKIIVNRFTDMLFGGHRFPALNSYDPLTQDFSRTLADVANLRTTAIQLRDIGGSVGTTGLSWCYIGGKPIVEAHNGKNLCVHEWESRTELIPRHVSEVFLFDQDDWDDRKRKWVRNLYWQRRDWLPNADLTFKPALFDRNADPHWEIDESRSVQHDDGLCHLVWTQNLPNSEDIDGFADYDGQLENMDKLDELVSVIMRGATLNLDPTVVLGVDPDLLNRRGISKGSDNALVVGTGGTASYMELNGASLVAGNALVKDRKASILDACQCVVLDPATLAAQGVSSVALRLVFSPMTAKSDVHRTQYGSAIKRVSEYMVAVARQKTRTKVFGADAQGNLVEHEQEIRLPPRVEEQPVVDPITEEVLGTKTVRIARDPGEATEIDVAWSDYFKPTPADRQTETTTLSTATGGKKVISQRTAVEKVSATYEVDPTEELVRIRQEEAQDAERRSIDPGAGAYIGGAVGGDELPPGALPRERSEE